MVEGISDFTPILNTISTGIAIIDVHLNVIFSNYSFNKAMQLIFNTSNSGQQFLSDSLKKVLSSEDFGLISEKPFEKTIIGLNGNHYNFILKNANLHTLKQNKLFVIEIVDISVYKESITNHRKGISTLSHEIRTPITAISLSIENYHRYKAQLTEEQKLVLLDSLLRNSNVLKLLVEDLLMISKIENKSLKLNIQSVDLSKLLDEVLVEMGVKISNKKIVINSNILISEETIGDPLRLSQIFRILIDNAIKYSFPKTKIDILFKMEQKVINHRNGIRDFFVFQIINKGIELKNEDYERIFNQYHRTIEAKDHSGTGLGLSIAKHLVKLHHGTISATMDDSREKVIFTVTLPYLKLKDFEEYLI